MTSPTPSEPLTGPKLYHGAPLRPGPAVGSVALAVGALYVMQIVLVSFGVPGLVASLVSDVVMIAVMVWFTHRRGLTLRDLGVRGAPVRFYIAACLLGVSMWYVTALLVHLVNPPGNPDKLEALVKQAPLAPALLALTVFPAIAEELVFRGVLARSLAGYFRPLVAIALSAATFAVYHVFPPQMVSTFALGLVLGLLAVKSRSIVPPILVHLLNNAVAVVLTRDEVPGLGSLLNAHPGATLASAVVLVSGGIALGARGVP